MRTATIDDIPAIREIACIAFPETYKEILSPEQSDYMMDMMYSAESLRRQMTVERNTFFLVPGKGYVSYRPDGMTTDGLPLFHLEKIYVMPSEQGTGLGRQLFEKVIDAVKADAAGPARIELNVNRHNRALSFYEHMGMRRERQGDFPIGNGYYMNDYIMALDV